MKFELQLFLFVLVAWVSCDHLIEGVTDDRPMIFHTVAQFNAFPLLTRERTVYFSDRAGRNISGIIVYDNLNSDAKAIVTEGGIGYTYIDILMKSEKGKGLDYDIGIYG